MRKRRSIITDDLETDFFDGSPAAEVHHCIYGTANRRLADEDGLVVGLTHDNHNEKPLGVHFNPVRDRYLKELAEVAWILKTMKQEKIMFEDAKERFLGRYGRNYL